MRKAARRSGALHGYAETEVFSPGVVKASQIVTKGGVGKVLWVRSRESHGGPHSPHFWDSEKTGGGAMHDLDATASLRHVCFSGKGNAIVEVMAWGGRLVHKNINCEDNALLLLKFASGGIGHCELSWTTKGGLDLRNEIHGSKGRFLQMSPEVLPFLLSQRNPQATSSKKLKSTLAGRGHCPRKHLPMATRRKCAILLKRFLTERLLARPMKTATW